MNPQPPDGRTMIETIGHELLADASEPQRQEIWTAMQQNQGGVKRLADQIRTNPRVQRPVPLLLSKLRSGAHLAASRGDDVKLSRLEQVYRLYVAKLADLSKHDALVDDPEKADAWSPGWTVDDDIAYAIDAAAPGDLELEAQLRQRAGLKPYIVAERPPAEAIERLKALGARPAEPERRPKTQLRPVSGSLEEGIKHGGPATPLPPAPNPLDDLPV